MWLSSSVLRKSFYSVLKEKVVAESYEVDRFDSPPFQLSEQKISSADWLRDLNVFHWTKQSPDWHLATDAAD